MFEVLIVIFGIIVVACASLMLLPVALALGALFLLFSGLMAGAELIIGVMFAIAAIVACVLFLHLLVPLLIPVLLILGIVYVIKHFNKAHA
jgi:hypothetical protein